MQTKSFKSASEFRAWIAKNHATCDALWLRIFKKDSGKPTVTYAEALDEALCHGWIDGVRHPCDEISFLTRFTPRRPKSRWSKINTQHAERLIKSGAMTAAGLKVIEAAKADGRWQAAYDSPANAKPPADFLKELNKNKKARAFFATLNRQNTFAIIYRLHNAAKPETRAKRMKKFLEMLARGEKLYP